MDLFSIVEQFRILSVDVENQPYIAREAGCVAGLVGFLANTEEKVVDSALETLVNLSSHADNTQILAEEPDLVTRLKSIADSPSSSPTLLKKASTVLRNLGLSKDGQADDKPAAGAGVDMTSPSEPPPPEVMKPFWNIDVQIDGMSYPEDRTRVEAVLVQITGVVSFVCDLQLERASVRAKVSAEELGLLQRLQSEGFPATLVNEAQDTEAEMAARAAKEKEAAAAPTMAELPSTMSFKKGAKYARALAPRDNSSLAERLEEQRRAQLKKKHKEQQARKSVVGFFKNIFSS
eukprot:tig00000692_g3212.t1